MSFPYPIVSRRAPILTVVAKGVILSDILSVGETALYVRRVGTLEEFVKYLPVEQRGNKFTFAVDNYLLDMPAGRYEGRLVYKGVNISSLQFVLDQTEIRLGGSTDV